MRWLVMCSVVLSGCLNAQSTDAESMAAGANDVGDPVSMVPNDDTSGDERESPPPRLPTNADPVSDAGTASSADGSATGESPSSDSTPDEPTEPEVDGFVEISNLFQNNAEKRRYGVAITDIDGDQDFEAVITGYGSANEVWDFVDGVYVDVAPEGLRDPDRRAIGVAACDMNGDGREEIYFLNVDRFGGLGEVSDRLFRRTEGGWTDIFEQTNNVQSVNRFSGRSVICFDRDGDGQYGVFVANYGGPMKLFEADESWRLNDRAPSLGMALTTGGRSLINIPAEDGRMQLFAGNENGPNFYFVGENPNYAEMAAEYGIADPYNTVRGVAVLDADEDGDFDLVYGNWEGPHRFFMNRDGRFEDVAPAAMEVPSRIRTVIAADFDNDGYEEIFWNHIGQPNRLFKRSGEGSWTSVDPGPALEPDGLGTGAAVADLNGDGRLELLVAHGESGAQKLSAYQWGRNANHFLRVIPLTQGGAPARGAVVTLSQGERTQRRVIDAGSGYLCQMEPVAHFGLGANESAVNVEVRWPDGRQHQLNGLAADQVVQVPYPSEE